VFKKYCLLYKLWVHPVGCGIVIPDFVNNNKGLYTLVTNTQTSAAYLVFSMLVTATHLNVQKYCQTFSVNPSYSRL